MRRRSSSFPVARAAVVSAVSATTMLTAAVTANVGGGAAQAADRPAAASAPTMAQTFMKSVAPVPSFLASAGSKLSLTQQTVAGMAAQKYGETPGLTAKQAQAVPAGFLSSLAYPLAKTGAQPKVIASAVGVLTGGNSTPEQPDQPGCTPNTAGTVSRVSVIKKNAAYRLVITKTEQDAFAPLGSWRLPTGRPTDVTVLEPNCQWSGPSGIAVTYAGRIDYFAFDGSAFAPSAAKGSVLAPATSWLPPAGTVLASAHVNADSSYFGFSNVDPEGGQDESNAQLLAVTRTAAGAVTLHELTLNAFSPNSVSDAQLPVGTMSGTKPQAAIAYDNDNARTADYALAVRAGGKLGVWFGVIGSGNNSGNQPAKQPGACAGTGLPSLSVADADANGSGTFNGVACANTTTAGVRVERWSNYIHSTGTDAPGGYPGGLHKPVLTSLPRLVAPRVFVTWPCELLSDWAQDQSPSVATCTSNMAADVIGTPARQVPRIYQLPTLGRTAPIASRPIAGAVKGAVPAVDQLPLDNTTITVHNDSASATLVDSRPVPLVYLMPAPVVQGLRQPIGGAPVSFGTTQGSGTGSSANFSTSVGGTVSATIGEPAIAAVDLSVSAEQSTGHTSSNENQVSSTQSLNDNANEPFVVYQVTPEWQWTGAVVADSTGLGVSHAAKVITQIAATEHGAPQLYADSVHQLSSRFPAFRRSGMYGATLTSVFGAGVFGGKGRTVADADPGAYPSFVPGRSATPKAGKAAYCDTHSGARGVTSVNSGVSSPYTPADGTATGPSFLAPQGYRTVQVGDSGSDSQSVTVSSSQTDAYSTQFSVNASAGLTVGGVTVTADAGFSEGNETSVTTSSGQTFAVEVGHITGASRSGLPGALARAIDKVLTRTETYSWEPFICHRTTALPGGGQTSALVLGFATNGFHGLAAIPTPKAPRALVGGASAGQARAVRAGSKLTFVHSGAAAAFRIQITPRSGSRGTTVTTPVLTPAQAAKAARRQSVALPRSVNAGIYRWRPVAVSFNGDQQAGAWRWIRVR